MTREKTSWQSMAACAQPGAFDTEENPFFAPAYERPETRSRRLRVAKEICAACQVFNDCLNYIKTHEETGVWAGMDEDDRYQRNMPIMNYDEVIVRRRLEKRATREIA